MAEGKDTGHPIQIYVRQRDGNYIFDEEAASAILLHKDVRDKPIMVLSIAGAMREGKSFLLNFFVLYLESKQNNTWLSNKEQKVSGFSWKPGADGHTLGILMWSKPFLIRSSDGEDIAILLMDTQGAFDNNHTIQESTKIFTMSLMMSSHQIYNVMQRLRVDNLSFFELFLEFAKLSKHETVDKAFQSLLFLVRDWPHEANHGYGSFGGESYIKKQLKNFCAGKKSKKDLDKSFDSINGYLMPGPGKLVAVNNATGKVFDGRISDISPDFIKHVGKLVKFLFSKDRLVKKIFYGEDMTGQKLFEQVKLVSNLLQKDDLPEAKDLAQAQMEAHRNCTVAELTEKFCTTVEKLYDEKPFVDDNELRAKCEEERKAVLNELEHRRIYGGQGAKEDCQARLQERIEREEDRITATNRNRRNQYRQRYIDFFDAESEKVERQLEEIFKEQCVEGQNIQNECQYAAEEFKKLLLKNKFGIPAFDKEFKVKIDEFQRKLYEQLTDRNNREREISLKTCEAKEGEILAKARTSLRRELKKTICTTEEELGRILERIIKQSLQTWRNEIDYPDFVTAKFTASLKKKLEEMRKTAKQLNVENKMNFNRDLSLEVTKLTKLYVRCMTQKIRKIARDATELKAFHEECVLKVQKELTDAQLEPALKKACHLEIRKKFAEEYLIVTTRNEESKKEYETSCRIKILDCREIARNYIKEKCGKDIKTEEELSKIHSEAKDIAIEAFTAECKTSGPENLFTNHLSMLQTELKKLLTEALDANNDNERVTMIAKEQDIKTAKDLYKIEMRQKCGSDEPIDDQILQEMHEECTKVVTANFAANLQGLPERMKHECVEKLKLVLQQALQKIQQDNAKRKAEKEQRQYEIITECLETYDEHMKEASKGHIFTEDELKNCHAKGFEIAMDKLNIKTDEMSEETREELRNTLTPRIDDRHKYFEKDNETREKWAKENTTVYKEELKECYIAKILEKSEDHACLDTDLERFHKIAEDATRQRLYKMPMRSEEIREQCSRELKADIKEWKVGISSDNTKKKEALDKDCSTVKNEAVNKYKAKMSGNEQSCLTDEQLNMKHRAAEDSALQIFRQKNLKGPQETITKYDSELKNEIENEYAAYKSTNDHNLNKKQSEATTALNGANQRYSTEMKRKSLLPEHQFQLHHECSKRIAEAELEKFSLPIWIMNEKRRELAKAIAEKYNNFQEQNGLKLNKQNSDIQKYIDDDCKNAYTKEMDKICVGIKQQEDLRLGHKKAKEAAMEKFRSYNGSYQESRKHEYQDRLKNLCATENSRYVKKNDNEMTKRDKEIGELLESAHKEYNRLLFPHMNGVEGAELQKVCKREIEAVEKFISESKKSEDVKNLTRLQLIGYLQRNQTEAENINNFRANKIRIEVQKAYNLYINEMTKIIDKNCRHDLKDDNKKQKEAAQDKYRTVIDYNDSNDKGANKKDAKKAEKESDYIKYYRQRRDDALEKGYSRITAENSTKLRVRSTKYDNIQEKYVASYEREASQIAGRAEEKWRKSKRENYFDTKHKILKSKILEQFENCMKQLPANECPSCETCRAEYEKNIKERIEKCYKRHLPSVLAGDGSCVIA